MEELLYCSEYAIVHEKPIDNHQGQEAVMNFKWLTFKPSKGWLKSDKQIISIVSINTYKISNNESYCLLTSQVKIQARSKQNSRNH